MFEVLCVYGVEMWDKCVMCVEEKVNKLLMKMMLVIMMLIVLLLLIIFVGFLVYGVMVFFEVVVN